MAAQSVDLALRLAVGLVSQSSVTNVGAGQEVVAAMKEKGTCWMGSRVSSGSGMKRSDEDGGNARKKLRRLSVHQAAVLEECFKSNHIPTPEHKLALANSLGLRPQQAGVWFQNRRARTKLKQTELECEFIKRRWEQLADENRRLQKEKAELRRIKGAPSAAGTLMMCLSCKLVATTSSSARNLVKLSSSGDAA